MSRVIQLELLHFDPQLGYKDLSLPKRVSGSLVLSKEAIFKTKQGEGKYQGEDAVFMRLTMCNLECDFCDTPGTWRKDLDEYRTGHTTVKIDELANLLPSYGINRLVITGGEPLIQQNEIEQLLVRLPDNWSIEVETNGTIAPGVYLADRCHFNVSPKLENSGMEKSRRYRPNVLEAFAKVSASIFKFVVRNPHELTEVYDLVTPLQLPPDRIYIQPQAVCADDQEIVLRSLEAPVNQYGWILSKRLHIEKGWQ